MREILFRGKCQYKNDWVYGESLLKSDKLTLIAKAVTLGVNEAGILNVIRDSVFDTVYPETIGQYTGLTDKNGKKVFEGDILVFCKGATHPYKIVWDGIGWKLIRSDGKRIKEAFECNEIRYVTISEVIGNIHDNPELLKGGEG